MFSGYPPDENTFLCGYSRVRRYGTTQSHHQFSPDKPNSFIMYQVQPTDTLEGIALRHNCSVTSLARLNKLWAANAVCMKEYLKIPIYTSGPSSSGTTPTTAPLKPREKEKSHNQDSATIQDILQRIDSDIKKSCKTFRKIEKNSKIDSYLDTS